MLSAIPNSLFYEGKLLDGCSAKQRKPLVMGGIASLIQSLC